jgi:hypothetical protein
VVGVDGDISTLVNSPAAVTTAILALAEHT